MIMFPLFDIVIATLVNLPFHTRNKLRILKLLERDILPKPSTKRVMPMGPRPSTNRKAVPHTRIMSCDSGLVRFFTSNHNGRVEPTPFNVRECGHMLIDMTSFPIGIRA